MVTVSHLVKKHVDENPFVAEGMIRGIISHPGLAEELQPMIEKELKKKIKIPAIVMSLRRYQEELEKKFKKQQRKKISSEFIVKSDLCVISAKKSETLFRKIDRMYKLIDYEKGDTFNVSYGNSDVAMIASQKHMERLDGLLDGEKILSRKKDLVAINIVFSHEYFSTPGVIFSVVRLLAWNDINIVELLSAHSELTVIVSKEDAAKAYSVLQDIMN